jgi:RNA polymerase sigma-70 factor (ECF subfamily)
MFELETLELVRIAQSGDEKIGSREAFGELVRRLQPIVFAVVLRRLRNRSEALEVTQDVFIQVMRKIAQLREPERFEGWVRRIAVRMAINRAIRRPKERFGDPDTLGAARSHREDPVQRTLRHEDADQLRLGLRRLRELDRQTLVAFYFEGRSLQQMSDDFASPVGTIKRRLHTARLRLREKLGDLQLVG